jgi:hypothetical protein
MVRTPAAVVDRDTMVRTTATEDGANPAGMAGTTTMIGMSGVTGDE